MRFDSFSLNRSAKGKLDLVPQTRMVVLHPIEVNRRCGFRPGIHVAPYQI